MQIEGIASFKSNSMKANMSDILEQHCLKVGVAACDCILKCEHGFEN